MKPEISRNSFLRMITIDVIDDSIEGEPGPNFFWRGSPDDFLSLIRDLHELGKNHGQRVLLNDIDYLKILKGYSVELKSSETGGLLCRIEDKTVIVDLNRESWQRVLAVFLRISFSPCHDYVEFDDLHLVEDANFIVSSEGHE